MMAKRFASGVMCGIVVLAIVSSSLAQEKPLTIETSTMQPSIVLGRPILTWWDVKVNTSGLLTGQLQFSIKSDELLLATHETEELTLNGPQQRIRVMLPPVDPGMPLDRLNVEISFRGKTFSGKIADQILRIPFSSKKVFVLLVGETKNSRLRVARDETIKQLKFESLVPETRNERNEIDDREFVKTLVASIDPADFPSEAMAYCSYDVVALIGTEFRSLRKPQLEGLLTWIKAGGSLYLEPNGVLEPYHLEFLKNLVADSTQQFSFQPDAVGRLHPDSLPPGAPATVIGCGLGNAAIRIDDPDQEVTLTAETWRRIATSLWKVRQSPVPAPMIRYLAPGPDGRMTEKLFPSADPWGLEKLSTSRFHLSHGQLLDPLIPDNVRMVPTWLLTLVLLVFVILVGPADYFILGWLRARSLTWVLFPIAAIAITALTVWLSNSYMSQAETRRGVVLCDVGPSGDIVRTNRIELLFVANSHRVTTEVQKGVFVPLSLGTTLWNTLVMPRGPLSRAAYRAKPVRAMSMNPNAPVDEDDLQSAPAITPYHGRIPTEFTVSQDLVKWTPQFNRLFSIPGSASQPEVDWSEFERPLTDVDAIRQHQLPPTVLQRVRSRYGPNAMVACFYAKEGWAYDRSPGWYSSRTMEQGMRRTTFNPILVPNSAEAQLALGESELFRWLLYSSVAPATGMFTMMDHTAPKGGRMCDDLLLFDSSDQKSWLLVIVVPEKEDFKVYRKLMRIRD